MKESENNLSFYSSAIIQAIFAILLLIILSYIYKLENMGCECSEHPNKDFIKNFTVIALGYFIITSIISLKSVAKSMGYVVVQLLSIATFVFFLMFVVYIYYAFEYVRYFLMFSFNTLFDIICFIIVLIRLAVNSTFWRYSVITTFVYKRKTYLL
jgi:hypothetical protein